MSHRRSIRRLAVASIVALSGSASGQTVFNFAGTEGGDAFQFFSVQSGLALAGLSGPATCITDASIGIRGDAFDNAAVVLLDGTPIGNTSGFAATPDGGSGPQIASVIQDTAGVGFTDVFYQFFPDRALVRQVLLVDNTTEATITVQVDSQSNVGADSASRVTASASGDTLFTTDDWWVVGDDASDTTGDAATTFVFAGPRSASSILSVSRTVDFTVSGNQGYGASFELTVEPSEFRSLMFFFEVSETSADALASVQDFALDAGAARRLGIIDLDFGGLQFWETIENWDFDNNWNDFDRGGVFEDAANWFYGRVPDGEDAVIDTRLPVTVTVAADSTLSLTDLRIVSENGRSALALGQKALLSVPAITLSPSGEIRVGQGIVDVPSFTNNGRLLADTQGGVMVGDVASAGLVEVSAEPGGVSSLLIAGEFNPLPNSQVLLRGNADLEVTGAFRNDGNVDAAFADSKLTASVINRLTGVISASGDSELTIVGDVSNVGAFIVGEDASVSILGGLTGNAIAGPGGP
ncbi:MAG: hypothetical protein AAF235_03785, partial [Planctomycetota bacterium]